MSAKQPVKPFEGVAKRGPEGGRIVITLEYTVPREDWKYYNGNAPVFDALTCLRELIANYKAGELTLAELIDGANSIDVVAAK